MGLRKKILIVEDNEFNRALLVEILSSQYETLEAENGKVGLEILEREGLCYRADHGGSGDGLSGFSLQK